MEKREFPCNWKLETAEAAFVAASAVLVGSIFLEKDSSVWYGAIVRGDLNSIRIGTRSNVQDGAVLHVTRERGVRIGPDVTVGHGAILHGCVVDRECLIGMGAILLDGVHIGEGSVVAAGSLVPEGQEVAPGSLLMGVPARVVRSILPEERDRIRELAASYVELAFLHASLK
ncbi:MAG: gamma carbonic anhydrase family protein [Synergistaceae bacterium]|jgi:carbonic anhydrase/acetyltransferase-like protein (isoleucine patch superfamily)|nr:gamma carbonic anhydrase family protein [Synergistaceae bacterium]